MHTGSLRALRVARSWHAAVAAIIAAALLVQLVLVLTADGGTVGYRVANYVSYFTVQEQHPALHRVSPAGRAADGS